MSRPPTSVRGVIIGVVPRWGVSYLPPNPELSIIHTMTAHAGFVARTQVMALHGRDPPVCAGAGGPPDDASDGMSDVD
jgi:hypothetical protein